MQTSKQNSLGGALIFALFIALLLVSCTVDKITVHTPAPTTTATVIPGRMLSGLVLKVYINPQNRFILFGVTELGKGIREIGTVGFQNDSQFWKLVNGREIRASIADLAVGQPVEMWFTEILESYPWQGTTHYVKILGPGSIESNAPLSTLLTPNIQGVITSINEYSRDTTALQLSISVTQPSDFLFIEGATFFLGKNDLVWERSGADFILRSTADLKTGITVSVLLTDPLNIQSPEYINIQEVVIEP